MILTQKSNFTGIVRVTADLGQKIDFADLPLFMMGSWSKIYPRNSNFWRETSEWSGGPAGVQNRVPVVPACFGGQGDRLLGGTKVLWMPAASKPT